MSRRLQENVVILALLAFFVMVLVISLGYGPNTRMVPVPVATLAIVLILFQFVWQNLRSADELNINMLEVLTKRSEKTDAEALPKPASAPPPGEWGRAVTVFGMIAALVVAIFVIGPIPSIFVFTAAYFAISGHFPLGKAVLYAAAFAAATYLLFIQILHIQPYNGYLEPIVELMRGL
jgi:Tripartite tricarboxylate transporter TctB family